MYKSRTKAERTQFEYMRSARDKGWKSINAVWVSSSIQPSFLSYHHTPTSSQPFISQSTAYIRTPRIHAQHTDDPSVCLPQTSLLKGQSFPEISGTHGGLCFLPRNAHHSSLNTKFISSSQNACKILTYKETTPRPFQKARQQLRWLQLAHPP